MNSYTMLVLVRMIIRAVLRRAKATDANKLKEITQGCQGCLDILGSVLETSQSDLNSLFIQDDDISI